VPRTTDASQEGPEPSVIAWSEAQPSGITHLIAARVGALGYFSGTQWDKSRLQQDLEGNLSPFLTYCGQPRGGVSKRCYLRTVNFEGFRAEGGLCAQSIERRQQKIAMTAQAGWLPSSRSVPVALARLPAFLTTRRTRPGFWGHAAPSSLS
jgi:hypothetical protein